MNLSILKDGANITKATQASRPFAAYIEVMKGDEADIVLSRQQAEELARWLNRNLYGVEVVERFNPYSKTRHDLFGCIDVLAVKYGELIGVQATSTGNIQSRIKKSMETPALYNWLSTGAGFECWGWAKRGAVGKRKLWALRRIQFNVRFGKIVTTEL